MLMLLLYITTYYSMKKIIITSIAFGINNLIVYSLIQYTTKRLSLSTGVFVNGKEVMKH